MSSLSEALDGEQNRETRILSLGGSETQSDVIEVYNCRRFRYPDLPDGGRHSGCALVLRDFLYYVGGKSEVAGTLSSESSRLSSTDVWRLNLKNVLSVWEPVQPMTVGRRGLRATVFRRNIFVNGGISDRHKSLSCGERYSPVQETWTAIPSLQQDRYDHALVTCQDRLYAIGGYGKIDDESMNLSSVERLKTDDDGWEYVRSMHTARSSFAAVCYNDCIHAIGGVSAGGQVLNTVEKYDPEIDEWSFLQPMRYKRFGCSACVLQGRIYVVGGSDEKAAKVKQMEWYNPITGWEEENRKTEILSYHSVVAV